ncbi:MAG: hypothetical protein NXI31_15955 [bacterium]|nr:hypothetical protein [bacterium]
MRTRTTSLSIATLLCACATQPPEALRKTVLRELAERDAPSEQSAVYFRTLCQVVAIPDRWVDDGTRLKAVAWLLKIGIDESSPEFEANQAAFLQALAAPNCHRLRSALMIAESIFFGPGSAVASEREPEPEPEPETRVAAPDPQDPISRAEILAREQRELQGEQRQGLEPPGVQPQGVEERRSAEELAKRMRELERREAIEDMELARPAPFTPWEHWQLSENVCNEVPGVDSDTVADANIATDLIWMQDHFVLQISVPFWLDAKQRIPMVGPIIASFRNSFGNSMIPAAARKPHFDDLFTYDEIRQYWRQLDEWSTATVQRLAIRARAGDAKAHEEFECLLGVVHHAVQDFYCHSNWIYLLNTVTQESGIQPDSLPTWDDLTGSTPWRQRNGAFAAVFAEQLMISNRTLTTEGWFRDKRKEGGLQTGKWERTTWESFGVGGVPWKHKHPSGDEHDAAMAIAEQATRDWTDRLIERSNGVFAQ